MKITFELDQHDVRRFLQALDRASRVVRDAEETDIVAAAKHTLDTLPMGGAPAYVHKRMSQVQRLIIMLEDDTWVLPQREREEVLRTLVYFSDPEDLIPDHVAVIGLMDDAIMLTLLLRRLTGVIRAYDSFCRYRQQLGPAPAASDARIEHAGRLARKRNELHARMCKRREAEGIDAV